MHKPLQPLPVRIVLIHVVAVALALLTGEAFSSAGAQDSVPLSRDEMLSFLAQCLFTAENGQPMLPTPARPVCAPDELQRVNVPARWRKHDYGNAGDEDHEALGYQVNDSAIDRQGGRDVVVQTFDFGNEQRRFHVFDKGDGDGGDFVALAGNGAYVVLTEDGGNGLQWFVGEACRTGEPDGRLKSWLLFRTDVRRERWREEVARLNIARSAEDCPIESNSAFTRYRRASIDVPFRITDRDGKVTRRVSAIDTIVSEHFGRDRIETADHLERFYFGRGVGKYRWERWEHRSRTIFPQAVREATGLKASGRCAPLPFSDVPGEGFVMTDCRFWTNLVWEREPWAVQEFGWPDVKPFGSSD